jgi:hypothetical protein
VYLQELEMGRSYMGGQILYGCPVERVTKWIHLWEVEEILGI